MPSNIRNLSRADLYAVFKTDQAVRLVEELIYAINNTIPADVTVVQGNLDAHIVDSADAHQASAIGNTPAGNIAATTVQAAINELDAEKQPLNAALPFIFQSEPEAPDVIPGPRGEPGPQGAAGIPVFLLQDDQPNPEFLPGPPGNAGAAGPAGAQGSAGPALFLLEDDQPAPDIIPGPKGDQGVAGCVGPVLALMLEADSPTEMPPFCQPTDVAVNVTGSILSSGTAGIGYTVGAGGAVTQATSKATGVTLNFPTGQITMNAASLGASTTVSFTLTNSVIAATDTLDIHRKSGGTALAYNVWVDSIAAGSAVIAVRNISAGALLEAVVLQFTVQKGSNT